MMRLRAVELEVTDLSKAAEFLERVWGLFDAGSRGKTRYFRATADHPYVLSLTQAEKAAVDAVTFAGSASEISKIAGEKIKEFDAPAKVTARSEEDLKASATASSPIQKCQRSPSTATGRSSSRMWC